MVGKVYPVLSVGLAASLLLAGQVSVANAKVAESPTAKNLAAAHVSSYVAAKSKGLSKICTVDFATVASKSYNVGYYYNPTPTTSTRTKKVDI